MPGPRTLDLNGDVGEGMADDAALVPWLTSVNVACGGHAGDDATMAATVELARHHGVSVGAHPGHEDRAGFGRIVRAIEADVLEELVTRQVERLAQIAARHGVALAHVKAHGALYHQLDREPALALAFVAATARAGGRLALFGPAHGALESAAHAAGLPFLAEGFVDRAYLADGTLAPRALPGALLADEEQAVAQGLALARRGVVRALDGAEVRVRAETLCIHGDTPGAPALARRLRAALEAAGVAVRAPAPGSR